MSWIYPRLVKSATYEVRDLPKSQWKTCSVCNGAGRYLESGDLHRSEGWVPCKCAGGLVKTETVRISKPVYRVPARTKKRMLQIVS